jgi:hypothetical protein
MFNYCHSLTKLDIRNFEFTAIVNNQLGYMINDCRNLSVIYAPRLLKYEVSLPSTTGYSWYLPDGTTTKILPQNMDVSVKLTKLPSQ